MPQGGEHPQLSATAAVTVVMARQSQPPPVLRSAAKSGFLAGFDRLVDPWTKTHRQLLVAKVLISLLMPALAKLNPGLGPWCPCRPINAGYPAGPTANSAACSAGVQMAAPIVAQGV